MWLQDAGILITVCSWEQPEWWQCLEIEETFNLFNFIISLRSFPLLGAKPNTDSYIYQTENEKIKSMNH